MAALIGGAEVEIKHDVLAYPAALSVGSLTQLRFRTKSFSQFVVI
jgi:hypothetical protein